MMQSVGAVLLKISGSNTTCAMRRYVLKPRTLVVGEYLISPKLGCMHLEPNGIVGFHEASCQQLLLVVSGQGRVRCDADEFVPVGIGDAVFWDQGERHETKTDVGLTAIVVEADALDPAQFMPLRK